MCCLVASSATNILMPTGLSDRAGYNWALLSGSLDSHWHLHAKRVIRGGSTGAGFVGRDETQTTLEWWRQLLDEKEPTYPGKESRRNARRYQCMGGLENTCLRSDDLMFLTSRSEEKRGHSTEIIFKTWFQKKERKGKLLLRESISSVLSSPSWPFKFWHQRFYLPDSLNHHCPTSTVHIQTKLIFAPNYKAFHWTVTLRPSVLTSGGETTKSGQLCNLSVLYYKGVTSQGAREASGPLLPQFPFNGPVLDFVCNLDFLKKLSPLTKLHMPETPPNLGPPLIISLGYTHGAGSQMCLCEGLHLNWERQTPQFCWNFPAKLAYLTTLYSGPFKSCSLSCFLFFLSPFLFHILDHSTCRCTYTFFFLVPTHSPQPRFRIGYEQNPLIWHQKVVFQREMLVGLFSQSL